MYQNLGATLYTSIGLDNDFISYLRISIQDFNSQERNVILHMDEIHVKSDFSYTGGRIIGSSITPNTCNYDISIQ